MHQKKSMGNVTNGINTFLSLAFKQLVNFLVNCRALIINRERYSPKNGILPMVLVVLALLQESVVVLNSIGADEQSLNKARLRMFL